MAILFLALVPLTSAAQYQINGNATQNSCNCYTLTTANNSQVGSVWNVNLIDLNNSFDFEFEVFLGFNNGGADGMVFGLQPTGTSVGVSGGGMGMGGVTPSLGVFMDTWRNGAHGDPLADHLSINRDGDLNHNTANNLAGPLSLPNIEDGQWHTLHVVWDAPTQTLTATFDNVNTVSYTGNIIANIFGGNPNVYWGFTAATGGANNLQQVCTELNAEVFLPAANTCVSDSIQFADSSATFGGVQSWLWDFGDGTTDTVQDPMKLYATPGTYNVSLTITDQSGCTDSETSTVTVHAVPDAGAGIPLDLCNLQPDTNLFDQLSGSPQTIGTWQGPAGPTGGNLGTFNPGNFPAGDYAYIIIGYGTCPNDTAVVPVTIDTLPVVGLDATSAFCSTDGAFNLFDELGGTPEVGGTWTGPSATTGGHLGTVDPATMLAGVYTYTLVGGLCPDPTADVTISINYPGSAGINSTINLCTLTGLTDYTTFLGGTPDAGGQWLDLANNPLAMPANPAITGAGQYAYITGIPGCADTAYVDISLTQPPDPGLDAAIPVCSNQPLLDLFDELGGAPQTTGSWSGPSTTTGGNLGSVLPATMTGGDYVYTVPGGICPDSSATVTVTLNAPGNAGNDNAVNLCTLDGSEDFIQWILGIPDAGGQWFDPGNTAITMPADPVTAGAGQYYYMTGIVGCSDTAFLDITLTPPPFPGISSAVDICTADPLTDLFGLLGGIPETGGSWTGTSSTTGGHLGTVDPALLTAGVYTYTVPGTICADSSATVTVNLNDPGDPGIDNNASICTSDAAFDFLTLLNGTPDPGGQWLTPGGVNLTMPTDPDATGSGPYGYMTGIAGCSDTAFVDITLVLPPAAGTDGAMTRCSTEPLSNLFDELGGAPQASGVWTGPSVASGGNLGTFDPATMLGGTYTYTVDGGVCADSSAQVVVTLNHPGNPGINSNVNTCTVDGEQDFLPFMAGNPDAGGQWMDPTGNPLAMPTNPFVSGAGQYTYTTGIPGCSNTATLDLTVTAPPFAGVTAPLHACLNDTVINLFSWLGGNPDPGGHFLSPGMDTINQFFDPAVNLPGTYRYVVPGVAPCPNDTARLLVDIKPLPHVSFTADDVEGCRPHPVSFTNGAIQSNTIWHEWDFGDGNTNTEDWDASHTYPKAGCFDVTLTVQSADGCYNSSVWPQLACAWENPASIWYYTPLEPSILDPTVSFFNESIHGDTWLWIFGEHGVTTAENTSFTFPEVPEVHEICLVAISENGCVDTTCADVEIPDELQIWAPTAFTPDGDGINDSFYPKLSSEPVSFRFWVFNRWGERIFYTEKLHHGWDGRTGRNLAQQGVYVWKIEVETHINQFETHTGSVTVIR